MRKHISAMIASALRARAMTPHGDRSALTITSTRLRAGTATYGAAGEQEQEKMQKYTCLMHPEVITDHPGNCPKCGMKLVPLKENKRRTPINREQASNSDKSRAGAQHSTSSSDHLMHDGAEMPMSHHHHGEPRAWTDGNVDALHHRSR